MCYDDDSNNTLFNKNPLFFITLSTVRLIRGLILDRLQVRNVVEVLENNLEMFVTIYDIIFEIF